MPHSAVISDAYRAGKAVIRLHRKVTAGGATTTLNEATHFAVAQQLQLFGYYTWFMSDGKEEENILTSGN